MRVLLALASIPVMLGTSCATRYRGQAMVLRVDPPNQTVLLSHRAIPNYMPAMIMPFHVPRVQELRDLAPGSQVDFDLVVRKHGSYVERMRERGRSDDPLLLQQP